MELRIAFLARAGSGKSTAFKIISSLYPKSSELKFAAPMYEIMYLIQERLGIEKHKDGELLQFIGEHFKKEHGTDFWEKKALQGLGPSRKDETINKDKTTHSFLVCTDCRTESEVIALRERGFIIVKITRPEEDRRPYLGNRDPFHPSETSVDLVKSSLIDHFIVNDFDLIKLGSEVLYVLNRMINFYLDSI